MQPIPITHAPGAPPRPQRSPMDAARAFETAFLAEMLIAAGTARAGGGAPTDPSPFDSFLAEAQARALVAAGGLGLAGPIAAALARQGEPAGVRA